MEPEQDQTPVMAARRFNVARNTLETTWRRYGIPRDRQGQRPGRPGSRPARELPAN